MLSKVALHPHPVSKPSFTLSLSNPNKLTDSPRYTWLESILWLAAGVQSVAKTHLFVSPQEKSCNSLPPPDTL